jgi:hypothetical protein
MEQIPKKSILNYQINDFKYTNKQPTQFDPYFVNNSSIGVFDIDKDTVLKNLNKIYSKCKTHV